MGSPGNRARRFRCDEWADDGLYVVWAEWGCWQECPPPRCCAEAGRAENEAGTRATQSDGELRPVKRTSWALGSMVAMTVLHHNESDARRAPGCGI